MTNNREELLNKLFFEMVKFENHGMYHYAVWSNKNMSFSLGYEKGYFDCQVSPNKNPQKSFQLIRLIRYLINDKSFYEEELNKVKRFQTLSREDYVDIFYMHYSLIERFSLNFNQEIFKEYKEFWKE